MATFHVSGESEQNAWTCCPWNPCHVIAERVLLTHVASCADRKKVEGLMECPFDMLHVFAVHKKEQHFLECQGYADNLRGQEELKNYEKRRSGSTGKRAAEDEEDMSVDDWDAPTNQAPMASMRSAEAQAQNWRTDCFYRDGIVKKTLDTMAYNRLNWREREAYQQALSNSGRLKNERKLKLPDLHSANESPESVSSLSKTERSRNIAAASAVLSSTRAAAKDITPVDTRSRCATVFPPKEPRAITGGSLDVIFRTQFESAEHAIRQQEKDKNLRAAEWPTLGAPEEKILNTSLLPAARSIPVSSRPVCGNDQWKAGAANKAVSRTALTPSSAPRNTLGSGPNFRPFNSTPSNQCNAVRVDHNDPFLATPTERSPLFGIGRGMPITRPSAPAVFAAPTPGLKSILKRNSKFQ